MDIPPFEPPEKPQQPAASAPVQPPVAPAIPSAPSLAEPATSGSQPPQPPPIAQSPMLTPPPPPSSRPLMNKKVIISIVLFIATLSIFGFTIALRQNMFTTQGDATGSTGSWTVTDNPPQCNGSWHFDTSYKKDNISLNENYEATLPAGTNAVLFDYDNDPKGSGSSKEVGHKFILDGREYAVPEQDPNNDDKWSTMQISGITNIKYSRNEDSGGSNICITGSSPSPTPTRVPTATPTPTSAPSVTPSPTRIPTPTVTKSPTPSPSRTPTPNPSATVTLTPSPTLCPSPKAVMNLKISCPLCQ